MAQSNVDAMAQTDIGTNTRLKSATVGQVRTFASKSQYLMPRHRTPLEAAAGKLIVAIQKEWGSEAGQPWAARSEAVMHSAHALLQAASKDGSIENVIGPGSVMTFLGWEWVDAHPAVLPYIADLEAAQ